MKVFIFLPDGVGLKNFAFTKFYEIGKQLNHKIVYWNNTTFPLKKEFGYEEIQVPNEKINPISDLYKRAKIRIELQLNYKETKDKAYLSYLFPQPYNSVKNSIKSLVVNFLVFRYSSRKGLKTVIDKIYTLESKTKLYKKCLVQLKKEQPDFVFCTNQRAITAVAPLLAAQKLNIPTATFIFSWDNVPKATLLVKTNYYYVWSSFMKNELLKYAPYLKDNQIFVTGTPQFEPHYDKNLWKTKESFYKKYNLEIDKKYICFSGDDITTSPFDEFYLEDLAKTIVSLNKKGYNLGIIYRKCPVDFTGRHLKVVEKHPDIITCIDPEWKKGNAGWNSIMPTKADLKLLANTILYSELVINVASSMVFDAVCHSKPCAYLNYNTKKGNIAQWDINKIYKFIHFKSMPSEKAVFWVNETEDFEKIILKVLNKNYSLESTMQWFEKINYSTKDASQKIWEVLQNESNK